VSRLRIKARSAKAGTPEATASPPGAGTPEATASPPGAGTPEATASPPGAGTPEATASPRKAGPLDKVNIFFAVFGAVAVVWGLLTHALLVIILVGLAFIGTFVIIAIYEKSIKWPAWRVIIALILVSGLLFIQYVPPRTEFFQFGYPYDWPGWDITKPPLSYFPVSDNPQTGQRYSNYELDPGISYSVNVRCWTAGHLPGAPHKTVDWVSIKGGSYDGLWIPLDAIASGSPGLARDLPNCNYWWFKIWPF
jgi:hypothetical protein